MRQITRSAILFPPAQHYPDTTSRFTHGSLLDIQVDGSVVPRVLVRGSRLPFYCLRSAKKLNKEYGDLQKDEQEKWLSEKKREANARAKVPFISFVRGELNLKSLTSTQSSVRHGSERELSSVISHSMMFATRDLKRQFGMPHNHVAILMCFSSVIDRLCDLGQFFNYYMHVIIIQNGSISQVGMTKS